ncbi:hypothetical protein [Mycoplasmopsis verecunda]|uniref:Lipoprotein n=1 Tax=Mycoplasmopsis verecunda TaxID=171291 RepID=A0A1T4KN41_9BACT|nr:hypothetical protein [Mycoplasmopsis verecunda]WPB54306.1 hypothetical protein SAM46_02340 [Mycoplasmopsis verecunda]SJZ43825.1 hypothetical protein SAMN02745154_00123 [Mycoplasmopsis verecunda]
MKKLRTLFLALSGATATMLPIVAAAGCNTEGKDEKTTKDDNNNNQQTNIVKNSGQVLSSTLKNIDEFVKDNNIKKKDFPVNVDILNIGLLKSKDSDVNIALTNPNLADQIKLILNVLNSNDRVINNDQIFNNLKNIYKSLLTIPAKLLRVNMAALGTNLINNLPSENDNAFTNFIFKLFTENTQFLNSQVNNYEESVIENIPPITIDLNNISKESLNKSLESAKKLNEIYLKIITNNDPKYNGKNVYLKQNINLIATITIDKDLTIQQYIDKNLNLFKKYFDDLTKNLPSLANNDPTLAAIATAFDQYKEMIKSFFEHLEFISVENYQPLTQSELDNLTNIINNLGPNETHKVLSISFK